MQCFWCVEHTLLKKIYNWQSVITIRFIDVQQIIFTADVHITAFLWAGIKMIDKLAWSKYSFTSCSVGGVLSSDRSVKKASMLPLLKICSFASRKPLFYLVPVDIHLLLIHLFLSVYEAIFKFLLYSGLHLNFLISITRISGNFVLTIAFTCNSISRIKRITNFQEV